MLVSATSISTSCQHKQKKKLLTQTNSAVSKGQRKQKKKKTRKGDAARRTRAPSMEGP